MTRGPTYALTTVVLVRSYSGARGSTSWEREICTPGISSATIPATRRSCAGFTNEKISEIATDSTFCLFSRRQHARTASSSSGLCTEPSNRMRSGTVRRRRRGVICFGGASRTSQMSSL